MESYDKSLNILFIPGILITTIGLFLPIIADKGIMFLKDFNVFGISYLYIFIAIIVINILINFTSKRKWIMLASFIQLFFVLSIPFLRNQWKQVYRAKFFLYFFKKATFGWYFLAIGSVFLVVYAFKLFSKKKTVPYLFVTPTLVGVCFLTFFPAIFAIFISFRKWNLLVPVKPFVGLSNYAQAITDEYFLRSLWTSFKYALGVVPSRIVFGFLFAYLIYSIPKFKSFFRVVYFLPFVTSTVAVSVIWKWIYHPYYGLANYFISLFGMKPINWLGNPSIAIWAVAAVSVWRSLGYDIIIFLSGINDIPETVLEASQIDGATRWQQFWKIIVPLIKPSLILIFITSTISAIQVFTEIYMMTGGSADTKTAVYYIWEYGFTRLQMGYACAMSMILFGIILIISLIQMRVTNLLEEE
ncbi:MAG TPA: sugar ABC transporter permease [Defluviitoga sp.]|nr:sugar ABC transporter permease [Defluviitoga sp.]HOP23758.1 sugar ABC transporter permease [Defluviitoga sp.]HPZ28495.1 sugar ABC transporter permease [Defluviitoga sp.]HQD62771.1 sugar ABC transporter permease [Defluviitoga sp.]